LEEVKQVSLVDLSDCRSQTDQLGSFNLTCFKATCCQVDLHSQVHTDSRSPWKQVKLKVG